MLRENSNNQPSIFTPQENLYSPEKKANQSQNFSNHQSIQNSNEYSPFVIKQSNTYNLNKPFTDRKILPKSSTKLYTPSPNTSKAGKVSDRYIPLNKGINLMEKFNMTSIKENDNDNQHNTTSQFSTLKEQEYTYKQLLKNNFMKENFNTPIQTNAPNIFGIKNEFKTNIFSFNSSGLKKKNNTFYSIINRNYQSEVQEEENMRKINPKPYKILNAPNIMDDFYLNLLDWSCQNEIAVGLGSSVVLWCTNQTKEMKLVDYNNHNNIGTNSIHISGSENQEKYVSSLIWSTSGNELAVGTSQGEVEIYDSKYNI